jgi:hypothetical protein
MSNTFVRSARSRRTGAVAIALLSVGGIVAPAAYAAPAATSGAIHIYVVSTGTAFNAPGTDIVVGAIIDHGHDNSVGNTPFQRISLSKGSFEINAAKLQKSINGTPDMMSCTLTLTGSGVNMPLVDGTGAYAAIKGTVSLKATSVNIGKVVNGKCDLKVPPVAATLIIEGTGEISY